MRLIKRGLSDDVEVTIGRAVIETNSGDSNTLTNMANFLQGIKEQPRPALTTKTDITNTGIRLIRDLMPHKLEDWQTVTVQETAKHKGGRDPLFQALADNSSIPVIIAIGKAKKQTIRGEQKPCLVKSRLKIYGANYLTKTNTNFAPLAMEEQSNELYQYIILNNLITRKVIAQDNSPEIQELILSKILHRTGIAMTEDKEAKSLRLIPMDILCMQMKLYVRRRAYRVICSSRKKNRFQLPTATVFKSHDHIKGTLCGSDMFTGIDFTG